MKKSDTYRLYKAGSTIWSLVTLHNGDEALIEADLRKVYDNLAGVKMPPSAPSLLFMTLHIEKHKWLRNLRDTVLLAEPR